MFAGTPEEMVREYMGLFGPAALPPEWVFGVWASANRWNCQRDVEALLEKLERYDFPASVAVLEAWSDEATFYIWNGAKYTSVPDGRPLREADFDFSGSPWPDPRGMIGTAASVRGCGSSSGRCRCTKSRGRTRSPTVRMIWTGRTRLREICA